MLMGDSSPSEGAAASVSGAGSLPVHFGGGGGASDSPRGLRMKLSERRAKREGRVMLASARCSLEGSALRSGRGGGEAPMTAASRLKPGALCCVDRRSTGEHFRGDGASGLRIDPGVAGGLFDCCSSGSSTTSTCSRRAHTRCAVTATIFGGDCASAGK